MHSTQPTLDSLLDVMREEPAVSNEMIASMLDVPSRHRPRPALRLWLAFIATVLTVGGVIALGTVDGEATKSTTTTVPHGSAAPAPSAATTTAESSSASAAPVGTSQPTGRAAAPENAVIAGATEVPAPAARAHRSDAPARPMAPEPQAPRRLVIPVVVDPSRVLELTRDELAAIGVRVAPDSIIESYSSGYSTIREGSRPARVELAISQFRFHPDGGTARFIAPDSTPAGLFATARPQIVTDLLGNRIYFQSVAEKGPRPVVVSRIRDSLNRARLFAPYNADGLIPVRVADRILWYSPTPGFIDGLPPCMREQIVSELDSAAAAELAEGRERWRKAGAGIAPELRRAFDSVIAKMTRKPAPCERPNTGGRLLDTWRSHQGAISSSALLPNNFRESTTLRVRLAEPRTIAVTLHDAQGRRVRQIVDAHGAAAGESGLPLHLESVSPGLYLVVVQTDRGERSVLRAVIE